MSPRPLLPVAAVDDDPHRDELRRFWRWLLIGAAANLVTGGGLLAALPRHHPPRSAGAMPVPRMAGPIPPPRVPDAAKLR